MKDSKFLRGQIWWLKGYEAHTEDGNARPMLIVSNEEVNSNMANANITVAPITRNLEKTYVKTNIIFDRHTGEKNIIKCGEIVTVNKNQLVSYESTVDSEVMERVDMAIKVVLGFATQMEEEEVKAYNEKYNFRPITDYGKIEDVNEIEEINEIEEDEYNDLINYEITKRGTRTLWNAENEALFMKMYKTCGVEETAEKFGISKTSVISKAYILRKKYPEFTVLTEVK